MSFFLVNKHLDGTVDFVGPGMSVPVTVTRETWDEWLDDAFRKAALDVLGFEMERR